MTEVGQRVVHDLRRTLFRHILDQSAAYFSGQTTGRLMSRLTNDVAQVQFAVSETIGDLTRESLAIVGYAAVLIYVDARLALVCLTGAPLVVYPLVRLGQRVRRTTRRSQEAMEHMAHVSAEAFAGHRIVKAFGAEAREAEKFERASERYYRTNMKVTSALSVLPPLMEFIGGVAFVAALWYGSQEITAGRLTTGDFVAFIAALFLMYGPAKKLSRVNASLQQAMAATERIFDVLDTHSEVTDRPDAVPMTGLRHGLEFRDVRFTYGGPEQPTLDGVTFEIPVGQTLALVGRSGAGKTTVTNLLARFYDPTSGCVLIDGRDIRELTLASLRAHLGMVTQETVLFDDTVAANIAYGKPDATRAGDPGRGAGGPRRRVHQRPWISGYDTLIGERGQRLSGGQRQRLAIARALLQGFADPDSRRGHVVARRRIRDAGPGSPGHADAEPHVDRDRAPAVHGAARRPDRRARRRPRRRIGHARRADRGGRRVCQTVRIAARGRPYGTGPHDQVDDRLRVADSRERAGDDCGQREDRQPSLPGFAAAVVADDRRAGAPRPAAGAAARLARPRGRERLRAAADAPRAHR